MSFERVRNTFWIGLLICFFQGKAASDTLFLTDYQSRYSDFCLSICHAMEDAKDMESTVLIIPEGVHHAYPNKAYQQYVRMTNNINGQKEIAIPIVNQKNLQIIGNGSTIMLHGSMMGIIIHGSHQISVKGIKLDWADPFYLQGVVEKVTPETQSYVVFFPNEKDISLKNGDLVIHRETGDYLIGRNFWFDPKTKRPVYNLEKKMNRFWNPYRNDSYEIEELGDNRFQVINKLDTLPQPGWHFIAKWRNQPNVNRIAPTIHIAGSKNVSLDKVEIYSAAGMGVIGERSENITLSSCKVIPTPDSDRIISSTADATHFVNCKGLVKIENCVFESSLDDGLNIHGNYATIREQIDDQLLLAEIVHVQQEGFVFAESGDEVEIINPETLLAENPSYVVSDITLINDRYFEVGLDREVKGEVENFGLENLSWNADLILRNCTIQNNWARGALFKTSGKVLIEDNYISSSMSGLRNWGEMNFFNESGRVTDVEIRNNTFHNVSRVGNGQPPIVIFPQVDIKRLIEKDRFYNKNIRITNNTFHSFESFILYAQSIDGLTFSNNLIEINNEFYPLYSDRPTIEIKASRNVEIEKNIFKDSNPGTVQVDDYTSKTLKLKANVNLIPK